MPPLGQPLIFYLCFEALFYYNGSQVQTLTHPFSLLPHLPLSPSCTCFGTCSHVPAPVPAPACLSIAKVKPTMTPTPNCNTPPVQGSTQDFLPKRISSHSILISSTSKPALLIVLRWDPALRCPTLSTRNTQPLAQVIGAAWLC